jgi:hypothetical protein
VASNSISFAVESSTDGFVQLVKNFPGLRVGFLSNIAASGRHTLKGMLLSGTLGVKLQKATGKDGRRLATAQIKRGSSNIIFRSSPMNFFEFGRLGPRFGENRGEGGRSGAKNKKKQAPKRIITGKFKGIADSKLQQWATEAERKVFQEAMNKV